MVREKPQILNLSRAVPANWQDIGLFTGTIGAKLGQIPTDYAACARTPRGNQTDCGLQTSRLAFGPVYRWLAQTSRTVEPKDWILE